MRPCVPTSLLASHCIKFPAPGPCPLQTVGHDSAARRRTGTAVPLRCPGPARYSLPGPCRSSLHIHDLHPLSPNFCRVAANMGRHGILCGLVLAGNTARGLDGQWLGNQHVAQRGQGSSSPRQTWVSMVVVLGGLLALLGAKKQFFSIQFFRRVSETNGI